MDSVPIALDLTAIIVSVIGVTIPIIGSVAIALINSRIKDRNLCNTLENAVNNSLGILQQAATGVAIQVSPTISAKVSPELAPAVQYVLNHANEALTRFQIGPEAVAEKVVSRIGLKNIETNLATTASAATPAIVPPLAPTLTVPVVGVTTSE